MALRQFKKVCFNSQLADVHNVNYRTAPSSPSPSPSAHTLSDRLQLLHPPEFELLLQLLLLLLQLSHGRGEVSREARQVLQHMVVVVMVDDNDTAQSHTIAHMHP